MSDSQYSKGQFFSIFIYVIVFLSMGVQYAWQTLLGFGNSIVTKEQYMSFLIYSAVILLIMIFYTIFQKNKGAASKTMFTIMLIAAIMFLVFWGYAVIDVFKQNKDFYLACTRYTGFGTTLIFILSMIMKIIHRFKKRRMESLESEEEDFSEETE